MEKKHNRIGKFSSLFQLIFFSPFFFVIKFSQNNFKKAFSFSIIGKIITLIIKPNSSVQKTESIDEIVQLSFQKMQLVIFKRHCP